MGESMLQIHGFWVELFPNFQNNYEFIYVFLDVVSVITMIRIFIELPRNLLNGGRYLW